jgi:hypothetical protein
MGTRPLCPNSIHAAAERYPQEDRRQREKVAIEKDFGRTDAVKRTIFQSRHHCGEATDAADP